MRSTKTPTASRVPPPPSGDVDDDDAGDAPFLPP
jgi:hypothetical protein